MSERISPVFNISANDKLYLAVARQTRDEFIFIIYMFLKT